MSLKPWREVIAPHADVLEGTFQQSEFAADITAVHSGKATKEYQDPKAFFERTYITEGMRLLLASVANRLNGKGGDPVIQLQTAFGGGKTHTILAVYHLVTREGSLSDLVGIPDIVDQAGLMDVPQSRVAVIDGTNLSPGQPWKHGPKTIHTLWGELGYQLGGDDGYALLEEADKNGTSPGKEIIRQLLEDCAPCVVLIDELVAYIRQFPETGAISGGSYDTNLSFVQALTEAVQLVPNAIVLASLPESEIEAGSQRGVAVLKAMEKSFGRVQALWKPVATEEAFEIVRRRLFEPVRDEGVHEAVCRAFAEAYVSEGAKMPSETQEGSYYNRLMQAYPIHPEVFDRLYEDWTTLEGFQRTRGVLKLMAKVIYRLWKDQNTDYMILPGSLPLYDGEARNELVYYLSAGWDAVLEKDIDGERAETTALESKEPRFGAINAARRVARALFFGSAPSAGPSKQKIKGIDRARILLGCVQPGQTAATYSDALGRLVDRLHYLNSSGDKMKDTTRFWFDTRANLRREMEDRKGRFDDDVDVSKKLRTVLEKMAGGSSLFEGTHVFNPHSDVPDDAELRLVVLPRTAHYSRENPKAAFEAIQEFVRSNGQKPRHRSNRLIFVAPDWSTLRRVRDCVTTALAWESIVDDVKQGRLNIDRLQEEQAKKAFATAENVLPRVARECFRWLLCPVVTTSTESEVTIEEFAINTGGSSYGAEIDKVCTENELVITVWSPIHLRSKLKDLYWKDGKDSSAAMTFWEDSQRYLYLPRLAGKGVLQNAIVKGAGTKDFFGTAYGVAEDKYDGFRFGDDNIQMDDTLLLIAPEAAAAYEASLVAATEPETPATTSGNDKPTKTDTPAKTEEAADGKGQTGAPEATASKPRAFYGSVDVKPAVAKMQLVQLAEEIINLLASDPTAALKITVDINAEFPDGATEEIKRAVSENASALEFGTTTWD